MAFVSRTIPNLYNGVSQQPITQRLSSQCAEQTNFISRVSKGLSKRPSSLIGENIQGILGTSSENQLFYSTNGLGEDIVMIVSSSGSIHMKNLVNGTEEEIVSSNSYLANTDSRFIKIISKGDRYFFLNKSKTVTKKSGTSSTSDNTSFIIINQGFFNTHYRVGLEVNGVFASIDHLTPDGSGSGHAAQIIPEYIANEIRTKLIAAHSQITTTNCIIHGNMLAIENPPSSTRVYFSRVGVPGAMTTITSQTRGGSLSDYTKLPANWINSTHKIRIQTDPNDNTTSYYVKYDLNAGAWVETVGLSSSNALDEDTMPIVVQESLVDVGGTLTPTYTQLTTPWEARLAGDDITAPFPSFINYNIQDMFFWGDRLGFLSGSNLSLSAVADISDTDLSYAFFPSTTAYVLDSDRIDISASTSGKSIQLLYALPQDRQLILYAKNIQMILTSSKVSDARLVDISEYSVSEFAPPILVGYNSYLPIDKGNSSGVMNFTQLETSSFTAEEITQHLPTYIKGKITLLRFCPNENMVFVLTDADPKTIYVQNRFTQGAQLLQNSWHKWEFPYNIKHIDIKGSTLEIGAYKDYNDGGTDYVDYHFLTLNLSVVDEEVEDEALIDFVPILDQSLFVDRAYLTSKGWTTGTITYSLLEYDNTVSTGSLVGVDKTGIIYRTDVEILEALETTDLYLGYIPYSLYEFSEQIPSIEDNKGQKIPESFAKLVLRRLKVLFYNTGRFKMVNDLKGRDYTREAEYSSMVLGSLGSLLGKLNLGSGEFNFPVNSKSDKCILSIISEHPYPCNFTSAEWSGTLQRKTSRY